MLRNKIFIKFIHIFLSINLILSNFYPLALLYPQEVKAISQGEPCSWQDAEECSGQERYWCTDGQYYDDGSWVGRWVRDYEQDRQCRPSCDWQEQDAGCVGCNVRRFNRYKTCDDSAFEVYDREDSSCRSRCPEEQPQCQPDCSQGDEFCEGTSYPDGCGGTCPGTRLCAQERTLVYEGGDCDYNTRHSWWVKKYSDGTIDWVKDHGEIPPNCGAVSPSEQGKPPQPAQTQPAGLAPESSLFPDTTNCPNWQRSGTEFCQNGQMCTPMQNQCNKDEEKDVCRDSPSCPQQSGTSSVPVASPVQTPVKNCPDWRMIEGSCLNGKLLATLQDQCNKSIQKEEARDDPDCAQVQYCTTKTIVSCVKKECDENLGEMVCIDDVQKEDCSVIRKPGITTGEPCGKSLAERGPLGCPEKRLNEFLQKSCDKNLGQQVWAEQWQGKNCNTYEKPGAPVEPVEWCGKNLDAAKRGCPNMRLDPCIVKKCDADTQKWLCIENWRQKEEDGECAIRQKDGVLTNEYCGSAFSILLERQQAQKRSEAATTTIVQPDGCNCVQEGNTKIWRGKECSEETQGTYCNEPSPLSQGVRQNSPDCEAVVDNLASVRNKTLQKRADIFCAQKARDETLGKKPFTIQDAGNNVQGILNGVGQFFSGIGTNLMDRITNPEKGADLRAEEQAKLQAEQAMARQQHEAAKISTKLQLTDSPAMQTVIMRNFLQTKASNTLSSIDPNSTEDIKKAFIDEMAKNCYTVTDNNGRLTFSTREGTRKLVDGSTQEQCVKPEGTIEDTADFFTFGLYGAIKGKNELDESLKPLAVLRDNSNLNDTINLQNVPAGKEFDAQRVRNIAPGSDNFYTNSPKKLLEQALLYKGLFDNEAKGTKLPGDQSANLQVYIDELKKKVPQEEQLDLQYLMVAAQLVPIDIAVTVAAKVGFQGIKGAFTAAGRTVGLVAKESAEQLTQKAAARVIANAGRNAEEKYVRSEVETLLKNEPPEVRQKVLEDLGGNLDVPVAKPKIPEAVQPEPPQPAAQKASQPTKAETTGKPETAPASRQEAVTDDIAQQTAPEPPVGQVAQPVEPQELLTQPAPPPPTRSSNPVVARVQQTVDDAGSAIDDLFGRKPKVEPKADKTVTPTVKTRQISEARSFNELEQILKEKGAIVGSRDKKYSAEDLIKSIADIRESPSLAADGKNAYLNLFTNSEDLRSTIIRLAREETERKSLNPVTRTVRTTKDLGAKVSDTVDSLRNRISGKAPEAPKSQPKAPQPPSKVQEPAAINPTISEEQAINLVENFATDQRFGGKYVDMPQVKRFLKESLGNEPSEEAAEKFIVKLKTTYRTDDRVFYDPGDTTGVRQIRVARNLNDNTPIRAESIPQAKTEPAAAPAKPVGAPLVDKEVAEKAAKSPIITADAALKRESDQPVFVGITQNPATIAKEGTTVVSTPKQRAVMISDDEAMAITGRLKDHEEKTLQLGEDLLVVDMGFDSARPEALDNGLIYLIRPGQQIKGEVKIIDKSGQVINLEKASTPVPFQNIQRVIIDGEEYIPSRDAWLNPYLYKRVSESNPINVEFSTTVADVASLWETAAANPSKLAKFIQEKLGLDAYNEIANAVAFVKTHPELAKIHEKIDPWELANLPQEARRVFFEGPNSGVTASFMETDSFQILQSVIDKIAKNENLTDSDKIFITALQNADLITREGMRGNLARRPITDLNEQYAIANMAEDQMLRQLIPSAAFTTHQATYGDFINTMKKRGLELPDWFTAYKGSEFRYGIKLNGVKANAGGSYFISFQEASEDMAHILDHERVHVLESTARDIGVRTIGYDKFYALPKPEFYSSEPYTEALALLIQNKGDAKAALAANETTGIFYAPGVKELLKIVQDVNNYSGDPLLGTELMLRGMTDQGLGLVNHNLTRLAEYYDKNLAGGRSFAKRMQPYSSQPVRFEIPMGEGTKELPIDKFKQAISNLNSDEINWPNNYWPYDAENFDQAKAWALEHPLSLLEGGLKNGAFDQEFLKAVMSDPEARKQMQALIDNFYIDYAKTLRNKVPDFDRAIQEALEAMGKTAMISKSKHLARFPLQLIKTAFAQETSSKQQIADLQAFEALVKKNLIKYRLEKEGTVDSSYINQILATNLFPSEFKTFGDSYAFTTGANGASGGLVQKETYLVTVQPAPGIDFKAVKIIDTKSSDSATIATAAQKGSGKVESIDRPDLSAVKNLGRDDMATGSAKVTVVVFNDQNGNGIMDKNENVLPWAGVRVELTKLNQEQTVFLEPGWNLITLTAQPTEQMTASNLISEIASQGGYATTVSTLVDGSWKSYVARGDKEFSNFDFVLEPGKAYFVKSIERSIFVFKGQRFDKPINLKLSSGWNTVGFPKTTKSYTASILIDTINVRQVLADALARFESGLWDTFVKKAKEEYGENFDIETSRGYILRMQKGGGFSP